MKGIEKPRAAIVAIEKYVPDNLVTTEEILSVWSPKLDESFNRVIKHLGVEKRYSVIDKYVHYMCGDMKRQLIDTATTMAMRATEKCLAKLPKSERNIGLLITVTNTADRQLPCTAFEIVNRLGSELPRDLNVLNMQNQGCSTLLKAVDVANYFLQANPDKQALIVVTEAHTCYLSPMKRDHYGSFNKARVMQAAGDSSLIQEMIEIVESCLFGDGAVSFIMANDSSKPFFEAINHLTNIDKDDEELLTLNQNGGLYNGNPENAHYIMSKDVPERGAHYAQQVVNDLLSKEDVDLKQPNEADVYFIHTGSKKIVSGVCDKLGLIDHQDKTKPSYDVLNNYGNLSSCSVGFMLEEYINQKNYMNEKGLIICFGAGFSASSAVINLN